LKKAAALDESQLAEKVSEIVNALQEGNISLADAIRRLGEVQQELEEGNLDVASINQGLEDMARELGQSKQLESAAESMARHDLDDAADEIRRAGEHVKGGSPEAKQMREKLQQASENSRPGLEELSKDLEDAAEALGSDDEKGIQAALDKAAQDLEKLGQKVQSQQLKNQANQRLQDVQSSLQQRQQNPGGPRGEPRDARQKGQPSVQPPGPGGNASQQPSPGAAQEEGDPGGAGGETEPGAADNAGGQMPSGGGGGPVPLHGAPTKLDVELEQEKLTGQPDGGSPKEEKTEEASRQERSKLDYRNVPSDLSPAQKDLLNQDRLPWEHRQLIKQYFQAIRPPQKQ